MEEENKDNIQIYELGYHLIPDLDENGVSKEVLSLKDKLESLGGHIISEAFPESKNLAYDISKRMEVGYKTFSKSFFGWVKFELESDKIKELHSFANSNNSVIRFIIVKTVRENTLYSSKMVSGNKKDTSQVGEIEGEQKIEISEEEINKSIDELIVE